MIEALLIDRRVVLCAFAPHTFAPSDGAPLWLHGVDFRSARRLDNGWFALTPWGSDPAIVLSPTMVLAYCDPDELRG